MPTAAVREALEQQRGLMVGIPRRAPMQAESLDAPGVGLYVPALQGSNVIDALSAPTLAQKPPAGHGVQLVEPGNSLNEPIAHAVHSVTPRTEAYEPPGHGKHRTLPLSAE